MNKRFDQLTKSMAQSVTRRAAFKKIQTNTNRGANTIWASPVILTVLLTFLVPALAKAAPCVNETGTVFRDDFDNGNADCWAPDSFGTWQVVNGSYVGVGTSLPGACASPTSQTLINNFQAQDIDIQVDMTSLVQVDKLIILRSTGRGDQIELNFRARRPGAFPADLVVQEWSGCTFSLLTQEFEVLTPVGVDEVGQTVHARVQLTGSRLHVWMNGIEVLDRTFNFANGGTGGVGLAVLATGTTAFDNVLVSTPGALNCYDQLRAALARQYGGLHAAAAALGYPSVSALQDAIRATCDR
jgi:hypothetical protein